MTPKAKANELLNKFCIEIPIESSITDSPEEANRKILADHNAAKQCAIIAVDEMIIQNGNLYLNGIDNKYYKKINGYLFEVKSEIEKL